LGCLVASARRYIRAGRHDTELRVELFWKPEQYRDGCVGPLRDDAIAAMNRKVKISLYLAAIFVAGVVTGMFISYQIARRMMPSRDKMANHWCGELQSKLNLTPEQLQKIRPMIEGALCDFRNNLSQEMLSSLSNCNSQVALELTAEQREKLAQLQKEQEEFIRTKIGSETPGTGKAP